MHVFQRLWVRLPASEQGQDAAENALLIGFIALAIVLAVTVVGTNLAAVYDALEAGVDAAFF